PDRSLPDDVPRPVAADADPRQPGALHRAGRVRDRHRPISRDERSELLSVGPAAVDGTARDGAAGGRAGLRRRPDLPTSGHLNGGACGRTPQPGGTTMTRTRLSLFVAALTARVISAIHLFAAGADGFDRGAAAVGGCDRLSTVVAVYREATIDVAGFQGTIKAWHTADGRYRKEERIATLSTVETFDGRRGMLQEGTAAP